MQMKRGSTETIRCIQWLRGIAAIAVLVRHMASTAPNHGVNVIGFSGADLGAWGVSLFFVISGFIMVRVGGHMPSGFDSAFDFLRRRVLRIAPLYWLITVAVIIVSIALPASTGYKPTAWNIVASALFVPAMDGGGLIQPPLRVGWSLNFEMYFYLMFAFSLLLPISMRRLAIGSWAAIVVGAGLLFQPTSPVTQLVTSNLVVLFFGGVIAGYLTLRGTLPAGIAWALVCLSTSAVFLFGAYGDASLEVPVYAACFSAMVIGLVSLEQGGHLGFESTVMMRLGDWSYSLYLTHVITLAIAWRLLVKLPVLAQYHGLLLVLVGVACIALAAMTYQFIEKPLNRITRGRRTGRPPTMAVSGRP